MKTENLLLLGIVVVGGFFVIGRRDVEDPEHKYSPVFAGPTFEAPTFEAPMTYVPKIHGPTLEAPMTYVPMRYSPTLEPFRPKPPRTQGRKKRRAELQDIMVRNPDMEISPHLIEKYGLA